MIVGEYGVVALFNTAYNMVGYSELTIVFTKPDGTTLTVDTSDGVALGVSPITTTLGIFAANQYVTYSFKQGDVDQAGLWDAYVIFDQVSGPTNKHLIAPCYAFTVQEICA